MRAANLSEGAKTALIIRRLDYLLDIESSRMSRSINRAPSRLSFVRVIIYEIERFEERPRKDNELRRNSQIRIEHCERSACEVQENR